MSSRSKEKVKSTLRRFFRGNHSNNNDVDVGNATASATTTNANKTTAQGPTTSSVNCPPPDANGNVGKEKSPSSAIGGTVGGYSGGGGVGGAISKNSSKHAAESPDKNLCHQVNKVVPIATVDILQPAVTSDSSIRARRLMKEYREIQRCQLKQNPVFTVELVDDSLFEWHARLHVVDHDSKLAKDMAEMGIPHILLHLVFPDNFPFSPPFMRVVEPRIEKGFVMEGGAICMELLTPRGWASAYTVEAVIMQFAASVVKGQGRIVRKARNCKDFTRRSAEESFRSLVKTHEKYGWVTPSLSDG